jgi:hypothetical protein
MSCILQCHNLFNFFRKSKNTKSSVAECNSTSHIPQSSVHPIPIPNNNENSITDASTINFSDPGDKTLYDSSTLYSSI